VELGNAVKFLKNSLESLVHCRVHFGRKNHSRAQIIQTTEAESSPLPSDQDPQQRDIVETRKFF